MAKYLWNMLDRRGINAAPRRGKMCGTPILSPMEVVTVAMLTHLREMKSKLRNPDGIIENLA